MSITGKASLSIKKQDLQGQKLGSAGFRKITFAHKAAAGETGINLGSLTTPTELSSAGFTQPSPALLAAANLKFFRNNLTLISSARGILQDFASYTVNNSTQINFTDSFGPALDGEIFTGIIDAVPRNDLVGVDSTSILASGTLSASQVQFNVGSAFKVNANPSTQIGEIAVYLDGKIQFRNSGNAAANPAADGNYQEIDNGSGFGTLIEFNDVDAINDRAVMVVGTGISVIRPNGSLVQELELLAGQIDAMIPTLADVAGVSESVFQSAPNNADLKAFGDRVLDLESEVSRIMLPTMLTDIEATKLGLKQFLHGTTYNGGIAPTVTATNWTTDRAVFIPYQMQDGAWRLRFNIVGSLSIASSGPTLSVNGVTFKNIAGRPQAISASQDNASDKPLSLAHASPGSSSIVIRWTVASVSVISASGDVELESKPTWAY